MPKAKWHAALPSWVEEECGPIYAASTAVVALIGVRLRCAPLPSSVPRDLWLLVAKALWQTRRCTEWQPSRLTSMAIAAAYSYCVTQ
jgi:hypothetical protein